MHRIGHRLGSSGSGNSTETTTLLESRQLRMTAKDFISPINPLFHQPLSFVCYPTSQQPFPNVARRMDSGNKANDYERINFTSIKSLPYYDLLLFIPMFRHLLGPLITPNVRAPPSPHDPGNCPIAEFSLHLGYPAAHTRQTQVPRWTVINSRPQKLDRKAKPLAGRDWHSRSDRC